MGLHRLPRWSFLKLRTFKVAMATSWFPTSYNANCFSIAIDDWTKQGKPAWQLLEPVDGFHSSQVSKSTEGDSHVQVVKTASI